MKFLPKTKLNTVKPRYDVTLRKTIFQRYFEINVLPREFYMGVYGEGPENIKVRTRENIIQYRGLVYRGFTVLRRLIQPEANQPSG